MREVASGVFEYGPEGAGTAYIPSVSQAQARTALYQMGKLDAVDAAINSLPEPPRIKARIAWEYASEIKRDHEFVKIIGPMIGLDDAALDALFVTAATL